MMHVIANQIAEATKDMNKYVSTGCAPAMELRIYGLTVDPGPTFVNKRIIPTELIIDKKVKKANIQTVIPFFVIIFLSLFIYIRPS